MGQKSTYQYSQWCGQLSFDSVIVQNNYHALQEVSSYVFDPTGLKEKDEQTLNALTGPCTVALFRFKPKAKAIDLGETI